MRPSGDQSDQVRLFLRNQSIQIRLFLQDFDNKISYKSSPNFCATFGPIFNHLTFQFQTVFATFVQLQEKIRLLLFQHLSHWTTAQTQQIERTDKMLQKIGNFCLNVKSAAQTIWG